MLLNKFFTESQKAFAFIYNKSFVLQNIDWLIFFNIILVILSSLFMQSDNIGYFAIFSIILTTIKLLTKQGEQISLTSYEKVLLIYLMFVIISVAGSSLFLYSLKGFCKTIIYLGFYISFVEYLKNNISKLKYIIATIALCAVFESIVAIQQNFLSVSEISGWQDMTRLNPEQIMTRVYGTLKPYNPNLFGGYMLAIIPTLLYPIFRPLYNKHFKTASWGLLTFLLTVATLVMTGCRGAYIGLFFQILMIAFLLYHLLKPVYKKIFIFISSALSSLFLFIIISTASLRARIFSIFAMRADSSNSFRFNVYNSCIDMFKDNWLLGIGVGNQNFREIYGLYMKTGFDALSAYNIYLETAVESGIFALIAFVIFLFLLIKKAIFYIFNEKSSKCLYVAIATISIIGILFHGFVDTVFFRPQIQFIFWIMVGIIRVLTSRSANCVRVRN